MELGNIFSDKGLIEAISGLTRAIDESTQQRRRCEQEVFDTLLARAAGLEKRLRRLAKAFKKLDTATTPQ